MTKCKPSVRQVGFDEFNNTEYERLLSCNLINVKYNSVEMQRYFALTNWVKQLPWLEWSGNSLKAYFDGLISQANAYKEKIWFVKTTLQTYFGFLFIFNHQIFSIYYIGSNEFTVKFLNGSNFKIELGLKPKFETIDYMNFTYYSPKQAMNLVNFTFYNNASQPYTSKCFDPSMISSGSFVSIPPFDEDIYTGFLIYLFNYVLCLSFI